MVSSLLRSILKWSDSTVINLLNAGFLPSTEIPQDLLLTIGNVLCSFTFEGVKTACDVHEELESGRVQGTDYCTGYLH